MANREYSERTFLEFTCPHCRRSEARVSLQRLERSATFECYDCMESFTVANSSQLIEVTRRVEASLKALHEEMDRCPLPNTVSVLGEIRERAHHELTAEAKPAFTLKYGGGFEEFLQPEEAPKVKSSTRKSSRTRKPQG